MTVILRPDQFNPVARELTTGIYVTVTKTVPQNAATPLFTIAGGKVLVTSIVGEVTTVIAGTTPSLKLTANPTVGADTDVGTAVAITSDPVGNLYGVPTVGSALQVLESVASCGNEPFALKAGTLDMHVSAADATGAIKWQLTYVPLDAGATVEAA